MRTVVLDIGGTTLQSGIFANGRITDKKESLSNGHLGGPSVMEKAIETIAGYSDFQCIGVSTAGQVNSEKGVIVYANENIPDYTGTNVKEILQNKFNVPVIVENDVNAAAMGEAVFGNGQKAINETFLCLTYGTGIGGAIVSDGKLYKGSSFSAGEFGHIITHGVRNETGYYEKYASTKALVKSVQAIMPELDDGRKIIMNIQQPAVKEIVDNWIDELLFGLASLIHVFNPTLVILGGGIMKQIYIIESLQKKIKKYVMPGFEDVIIVSAALGSDAGLWGIGYMAGLSNKANSGDNSLGDYTKLTL